MVKRGEQQQHKCTKGEYCAMQSSFFHMRAFREKNVISEEEEKNTFFLPSSNRTFFLFLLLYIGKPKRQVFLGGAMKNGRRKEDKRNTTLRKNQETSLVLPPPPKKTEEGGSHTTSATVFDLHSFDPWLWLSTSSSFVIRCPRGGSKKTRLIQNSTPGQSECCCANFIFRSPSLPHNERS